MQFVIFAPHVLRKIGTSNHDGPILAPLCRKTFVFQCRGFLQIGHEGMQVMTARIGRLRIGVHACRSRNQRSRYKPQDATRCARSNCFSHSGSELPGHPSEPWEDAHLSAVYCFPPERQASRLAVLSPTMDPHNAPNRPTISRKGAGNKMVSPQRAGLGRRLLNRNSGGGSG